MLHVTRRCSDRRLFAAAVVLMFAPCQTLLAQAVAPSTALDAWRVDAAHSAINFRVRHLGITWVNGTFKQWTVELNYDVDRPEATTITAKIQTASVNTDNDRRDADVRDNYLEVAKFPEMSFVSRKVTRAGNERWAITGDLTMHGVTKSVVLDAELSPILNTAQGRRVAVAATTTVKRQDFGILRNGFMEGAQIVGDEVRITIDIEAIGARVR